MRPLVGPGDKKRVRNRVLAAATLAYSLVILDVTAMNVVAPVIQQELDASVSLVQWVINAYTLFLASLLLLGGALADRFGRRFVLGTGGVLFALGSLGAALAPGAFLLIGARAVQGLGSAFMVPAGLGLIAGHFPPGERGRAIGLWGGLSGLGAVAGPLLGGLLSDLASWRWLFVLYLPLSLVMVSLVVLTLPRSRLPPDPRPLDLPGSVVVTAGLFALVFALIRAGVEGFRDPFVLVSAASGVILLALFFLIERGTRASMLTLFWFRDRDHTGAHLVTFCVFFALAAGMLFVPMRLLTVEGWRPTAAGAAMLPTLVMIGLFAPRFGALVHRVGVRPLAAGGAFVAAIGYLVLAVPGAGTPYFAGLFWGLVLVGLGMAMLMAPITVTVLATVEGPESARAAGLNNAVSRLGALFAIALAGIVALTAQAPVVAQGLAGMDLDEEQEEAAWRARTDLAHARPPESLEEEEKERLEEIYREGFLAGYRAVQSLMAAAALAGAVLGWTVLRGRARL